MRKTGLKMHCSHAWILHRVAVRLWKTEKLGAEGSRRQGQVAQNWIRPSADHITSSCRSVCANRSKHTPKTSKKRHQRAAHGDLDSMTMCCCFEPIKMNKHDIQVPLACRINTRHHITMNQCENPVWKCTVRMLWSFIVSLYVCGKQKTGCWRWALLKN